MTVLPDPYESSADPWGYESSTDDFLRRERLLASLPRRAYGRVLDIGCGTGFITERLPGLERIGVDVSAAAVRHATARSDQTVQYICGSVLALPEAVHGTFDLVVVTGVLYPQYIGRATRLAAHWIDRVLARGGILASVHIDQWYGMRFPYLLLDEDVYPYRQYRHRLEVYAK